MTKDRRHKATIRAHQATSGTGYLEARRQTALLAEVMEQHPQLSSFGIGVFDQRHKTAE